MEGKEENAVTGTQKLEAVSGSECCRRLRTVRARKSLGFGSFFIVRGKARQSKMSAEMVRRGKWDDCQSLMVEG